MKSGRLHLRALGIALLGYALWVVSDMFMKLAGESNLPPYEILGFLGMVGCAFLIIKTGMQGKLKNLWPRDVTTQMGRAVLSLATNFCNVIALKHLPLSLFFVTVFTAPIMIALLARFMLNERLSTPTIIAIVVGFIGVIVAVNPGGAVNHGDFIGYGAALVSTLSFALATITARSSSQTETTDSLGFFSSLCNAVVGIALMLHHSMAVSFPLLLILIGMGLFCILGNLANYWALRHTSAGNVASLHYSQIVTGALFGYLIWHDVPTMHLVLGVCVIILSGIYVAAHVRKSQ